MAVAFWSVWWVGDAAAQNLLVSGDTPTSGGTVNEYDATTGVLVGPFISPQSGDAQVIRYGPDDEPQGAGEECRASCIDDCPDGESCIYGAGDPCDCLPDVPTGGDLNGDGVVDGRDYAVYVECVSGPGGPVEPGCEAADFDQDLDVDFVDFGGFQWAYGQRENCVPAGGDCFVTECPNTYVDFRENPIPPGFFGRESDGFFGLIQLRGRDPEAPDTIMLRLEGMCFSDDLPSVADVPIELVALDLVSCDPIVVDIGGIPTWWDVEVGLSDTPVPVGFMTVTKAYPNGGTFDADFAVQPVFTFTRVDDPADVRVLDTGEQGMPPDAFGALDVPWVHQLTVPGSVCGINFAPGVTGDDPQGGQCCNEVCHPNYGGTGGEHCTRVPAGCPECP